MIYTFIRYHEKIFPIERCGIASGTKKLSSLKNHCVSQSENKESCKRKVTSIYFDPKQRYRSPENTSE
jgi:tryptophanyl-tRNA synthetase